MCSVENVKKIRQTNFRNFFVAVKWFHEKTSKGENVLDYQTADIFRENDLWNTTISPQMKLSVKMKKHSIYVVFVWKIQKSMVAILWEKFVFLHFNVMNNGLFGIDGNFAKT